jgi:hypothetical protein
MKVNEYLPNLDAKSRFDLMHWNVSIGPENGLFSNVISIKMSRAMRKNTSNMATVGDVTCKSSIPCWLPQKLRDGNTFCETVNVTSWTLRESHAIYNIGRRSFRCWRGENSQIYQSNWECSCCIVKPESFSWYHPDDPKKCNYGNV